MSTYLVQADIGGASGQIPDPDAGMTKSLSPVENRGQVSCHVQFAAILPGVQVLVSTQGWPRLTGSENPP